jgi:hypothetical protein
MNIYDALRFVANDNNNSIHAKTYARNGLWIPDGDRLKEQCKLVIENLYSKEYYETEELKLLTSYIDQ